MPAETNSEKFSVRRAERDHADGKSRPLSGEKLRHQDAAERNAQLLGVHLQKLLRQKLDREHFQPVDLRHVRAKRCDFAVCILFKADDVLVVDLAACDLAVDGSGDMVGRGVDDTRPRRFTKERQIPAARQKGCGKAQQKHSQQPEPPPDSFFPVHGTPPHPMDM